MSAFVSVVAIAFGMILGVVGMAVVVMRPQYTRLHRFGVGLLYACYDPESGMDDLSLVPQEYFDSWNRL